MKRVLFILKRREIPFVPDDNPHANSPGLSTGLFNSASFVKDMLIDLGVESKLVVAIDNNYIDREVKQYQPTHVIIEALWVVPSKFDILTKLHPKVKWIIRLHSEMPFLACEGMSMDWLGDYVSYPNLSIAINAPRLLSDVRFFLKTKMKWSEEETNNRVFYLPNYYPQEYVQPEKLPERDTIDIACFGAIRPLKNHMIQAIAALQFAESMGKKLNFHINTGRMEMKGEPVFNNLKALFIHLSDTGHKLIDNKWTPREEFLQLCKQIDIGMQVSLSETFNIVGADFISQGVPLVLTTEIPWAVPEWCVTPTETDEVLAALKKTYYESERNVIEHQKSLTAYTTLTKEIWKQNFASQ